MIIKDNDITSKAISPFIINSTHYNDNIDLFLHSNCACVQPLFEEWNIVNALKSFTVSRVCQGDHAQGTGEKKGKLP